MSAPTIENEQLHEFCVVPLKLGLNDILQGKEI